MRDVYCVYAVAAIWASSAIAYLAIGRGAAHERVERVGGTMLLGKGVMNWTYWMTEPIVRRLVALDITANALTWTALVLGVGAGVALGFAQFGLACLLATVSTICDILDGQVARHTHTGSDRGELLDAAVDRYTELAFAGGFIMLVHDSLPLVLVGLAALQSCVMISYASAKAEAFGIPAPRGLMRRHERTTYLIAGVGLTSLCADLAPAIVGFAIVAVVGNLSAITRLVRIAAALR